MNSSLAIGVIVLAVFLISWAFARAIVWMLARAWRAAPEAHWTERARLAFAPAQAQIWLGAILPPALAVIGTSALQVFAGSDSPDRMFVFWIAGLFGVLVARYRFVRECWGVRVNLRNWISGIVVLLVTMGSHWVVMLCTLNLMPEKFGTKSFVVFSGAFLVQLCILIGDATYLLRWLRIARPAPAYVTAMVGGLCTEMGVKGGVSVYVLEWAQVNALASTLHRWVGFSNEMVKVMSLEELRSIAAHELGHLLEPAWLKCVRIAQRLIYLPTVFIFLYGGPYGFLFGVAAVLAIMAAYKRVVLFGEKRADRLQSAASQSGVYMSAMVKLHELNLQPAVMPGKQTHPDLYDRLLAAGFQPDFPRPLAPSGGRPLWVAIGMSLAGLMFCFVLMVGIQSVRRLVSADDRTQVSERYAEQREIPVPDFTAAGQSPIFQAAAAELASLFKAKPEPFVRDSDGEKVNGAVSFALSEPLSKKDLFRIHTNMLARGFYVFSYETGTRTEVDTIGFIPTQYKHEVVATIGTQGGDLSPSTHGIISWLMELEAEQDFFLTGIGLEHLEGTFKGPVKNLPWMTKMIFAICPDIAGQGESRVLALTDDLKKGEFFLWWD